VRSRGPVRSCMATWRVKAAQVAVWVFLLRNLRMKWRILVGIEVEPMLNTTQVCLFTKRSETLHMYPQMTLPRTVLWNYKVCSLVTKIMPPDLLGENFTPDEISDSPGFPIFHNFKSKENLLWASDVLINCPTRNQKAQACKHQAHPCQSLYPWCLERVAAQVHVLLEPCYILATCSKLWSISGNVYFFFLEIWQLCGLLHQTTFAGFPTLFICCQVAILRPKKNTIHKQGSFISILWYQKFDENFQQIRKFN
jgi:hypothetical protein